MTPSPNCSGLASCQARQNIWRSLLGRPGIDECDDRRRRLLRARRERPRCRHAAKKGDELAPSKRRAVHSITSSAVASRVGGTARPSILAVSALSG
jgi:hypothetical protein